MRPGKENSKGGGPLSTNASVVLSNQAKELLEQDQFMLGGSSPPVFEGQQQ
jgi:hypothetical protein